MVDFELEEVEVRVTVPASSFQEVMDCLAGVPPCISAEAGLMRAKQCMRGSLVLVGVFVSPDIFSRWFRKRLLATRSNQSTSTIVSFFAPDISKEGNNPDMVDVTFSTRCHHPGGLYNVSPSFTNISNTGDVSSILENYW